jgi:hypothetical protein
VADRLERIAKAFGDPARVLAGTDCGFRHLGWDGTGCRGYCVGKALLPGRGRPPCLTVPVRLATPFSTQLRAIRVWRTSCEH